jgi:hypothetical protein
MPNKETSEEKPGIVKPVKARGKAIRRTEAELDEMTSAEAMEAFAEDAADDWRENAPKKFKTLLDGEKSE